MTAVMIPLMLAAAAIWGLYKGVDIFAALTAGARQGLDIAIRLLPTLVILLSAIAMLRASGVLDAATAVLTPLLTALGIPSETAALMMLRPISGSGALALGSDLFKRYGADSLVGRTAAIILGSTETTFYVIGVYLPAAGVRRGRYILPAALMADFVSYLAASILARVMWS